MKKLLVVLAVLGLSLVVAQDDEVFVIQSLPGGPVSFDPVRAYDSASGEVLQNVYETLFYYDGEAIDQFVPQLATDFSVSDDGTSYTFTLREGVMFHSGNMMSCKDVEYSLQYGMVVSHPRGANAYLMGNQFLGTQIDSSDPAAFMEAVSFDMIDAAVTCPDGPDGPDGLTAQLNLTKPDPALLAILAYTAFSVIDSEWAIANGMWDGTADTYADWAGRDVEQEFMHRNTSGTGAYRLVDWNEEAVVLEAFDDYWGGAPDIENVVIQYIETDTARILALQQGDADIITINEHAELIKLRGSEGVTIVEEGLGDTGVTAIFFNFGINTDENEDVGSGQLDGNGIPADFFTNVDVRRAFAHLYDQEEFIAQPYEGSGYSLTMPLPRTFLGYNEELPVRLLDLEAAERYFRTAFDGELWDTGFEFTALHNAGNTIRQTSLELIAENLAFINPNFRMNVRGLPWADFLTRTADQKAPIFALGWGADYADPRNFINTFFDNDGFYSGRTSINIPEIQELIDQADAVIDPVERAFLYEQIGSLYFDLVPLIAVPEQENFHVYREGIEGIYYNPMITGVTKALFRDIVKP